MSTELPKLKRNIGEQHWKQAESLLSEKNDEKYMKVCVDYQVDGSCHYFFVEKKNDKIERVHIIIDKNSNIHYDGNYRWNCVEYLCEILKYTE